jgi:hypothetical protein
MSRLPDIEKVANIMEASSDLLVTWIVWRKTHDVESAKIQCCEKSSELFEALEKLAKAWGADEQ